MNTSRSKKLYEEARRLIPGGVSSPVRAYQPYPRYIERGHGAEIFDVDGNGYIDYCMAYGPLILGHARPEVVNAITAQAAKGTLYGAPIEMEVEMAKLVSAYYPPMKMMRFVNSGTEATMHAIRTARGYTNRKKIIKIEGAFHGAHDSVLVKAGSGATTHSAPNSLGVPEEATLNTVMVPYNDLEAMRAALKENRNEVAAIILEPVLGNIGPVLPKEGYLQGLREIAAEESALLIFDEVITGFRLGMGGAQQYFGVKPDMVTLGKIVGGGLPIGVFGGSEEIMSVVSPAGKVYQAGTFCGNPLSLAAGLETLKILKAEGHGALNGRGDRLRSKLQEVAEDRHLDVKVRGIGSMFQIFLTKGEVTNYADAMRCDSASFMKVFQSMLDKGVYLPPSQFETNFLSMAHNDGMIDRTVDAFSESFGEVLG